MIAKLGRRRRENDDSHHTARSFFLSGEVDVLLDSERRDFGIPAFAKRRARESRGFRLCRTIYRFSSNLWADEVAARPMAVYALRAPKAGAAP